MSKTILKLLLASMLLLASACAPGQPTPDLNTINTAIAQTMAALSPTSEPGIPVTGNESPTPTASPEVPTPSATMTAIPLFTPTPDFTAVAAQVSVSVPTNCRVGPGVVYPRVGGLQLGEVAEVVGRHATRDYWIIRNPDRPGETCWLWGQYATLTGNTDVLPIFTPPPTSTSTPTTTTPDPGFVASYGGLGSCTGVGWWVDIELENRGGINFTSMSMTVEDTVTTTARALHAENFTNRSGCNETDTRDTLPTGTTLRVSSPAFTTDLSGHIIRATVTLCSNPGQSGTCATRAIQFTP